MKHIGFIVGTGRCGTTIIGQVLNSHSKICVPHELQIVVCIGNGERLYDKSLSNKLVTYTADDFIRLIDDCCPYYFERYFDYVTHFRELQYPQTSIGQTLRDLFDHICFDYGKEIFFEQTPWYGQRLGILKELFPEMKVMHLIRDGRDVAISFARTPWWSRDIRKNLQQWQQEVTVIHEYGRENPAGFLEIRYEDLVLNPEKELKKIMTLFDLSFEDTMLDPARLVDYSVLFKHNDREFRSDENRQWLKKKRNVFFPESIGAWKRFQEFDFSVLPLGVARTLQLFDYEV